MYSFYFREKKLIFVIIFKVFLLDMIIMLFFTLIDMFVLLKWKFVHLYLGS